MENPEITLSEYWRIIRKRKGTILFVLIFVMLSTVFFTKMQIPVYQSNLELKIEKRQPIAVLESQVQTSQQFLDLSSVSTNLATEIRLIKSIPVLKKVVEKMEVLPIETDKRSTAIHRISLEYQKRIAIAQIEGTDIVEISVISNDAQDAALMATAIADVYIVENIASRKRQAKTLIGYIENQLSQIKGQIVEEENELQKFKQNEKVFEVIPEVKEVLDRMTIEGTFEFEEQHLFIESELKKVNEALDKKEPTEISQMLNNDTWTENFIFIGLKRRLLELEFERFLFLIDYTEKHPSVIAKHNEIAEVKNKIAKIFKDVSNIPMTLEAEEYLAYTIKKLFAETRKDVLYRIINGFYGDTGSLSSNQMQYVRLKRNIDRLIERANKLLGQKQEVQLSIAKVIDDVVTVVSPAIVPNKPIKPNAKNNFLVSIFIGLLLGVMFCFVRESLDSSIATISDVEQELALSMLGIIPHMTREEVFGGREFAQSGEKERNVELQQARLVTITNPKSWAAESMKMLRTNLIQLMKTNNLKTILFTSSDKQEGKSTIVANIALSMAQLGRKTLLIGSNLRRPTVYKIFGLTRGPGLSDVLMGNIPWKDALRTSTDILTGGLNVDDILQMPGIDNLNILPCGRPVDNDSEIRNSKVFDSLLDELKQNYDLIIVDCSPVMAVPDAITLCDKVDGLVLVYKVGHTPKDILKRAKSNLLNAKANILGIVLNNIKTEAQVGYSAYYYRYYADTPEKKNGTLWGKWKDTFSQSNKKI